MKFIKRSITAIILLAAVLLCGCVNFVERFYPDETSDPDETYLIPTDLEEGSLYFKDFDGNDIILTQAPDKVASLSEVSTEILCGIGAGRYISAMNEGSLSVEGAPISAKVLPDFYSDTQKLIELAPDIVFYSENSLSYLSVTMLKNAGLTLIRIPDKGSISTAESNIRFISSLMFKSRSGDMLIDEMRDEFKKMKVAADFLGLKKRVYIESTSTYYGYGADSIISELCGYAGAENVFSERKGTFLTTPQELKLKDPDVIIVLTNDTENFSMDMMTRRDGLDDVYAVRTKAVYAVDVKTATRPTQNITKALKSVGRALKVIK